MSAVGSGGTGGTGGSSTLGFRPGLDGLRAVAVLAVIAYHLGAPWMRGGFLGVDLFMVLSGFLITSLLLVEHDRTGRISMRSFWARRVRRILPAVVVVLTAVAVYAAVWASAVERAALRWESLASLTSWANWWFAIEGDGYWAAFGPTSPLTHFWSLAVEEQFYMVWPPVVAGLLLAARRSRAALIGVTLVGTAASAITMAVLYDPLAPSRAYLGTDTRVQTLLVGAVGAVMLRWVPGRAGRLPRWSGDVGVGAAVLVAVALVRVGDRDPWMYHGGFTAFAVLALVAVVVAADQRSALGRALGIAPLVWIGRRSFGWYLWHWPLIVLVTPERVGLQGPARIVVVLTLTVLFAELSFRLVEQPIRLGRRPGAGGVLRRLPLRVPPLLIRTPALMAGLVVMSLAVALVFATRVSMPERPDLAGDEFVLEPVTEPIAAPTPGPVPGPGPIPGASELADQRRGSAGGLAFDSFDSIDLIGLMELGAPEPLVSDRTVRRVVIQGDSVALFSSLPVVEAFGAAGIDVVNLTFPGQSLSNPAVLDAVTASGADLSIWQLSLWDDGDPDAVRSDHERFVEVSLAAGADVVFVDRPPVRPDLETDARQLTRVFAAELAAQHPDRVRLLDPLRVWGPTVVIDGDGDGLPERFRDEVHVCPQGSARWTAWLLESLAMRYAEVVPADPVTWIDGTWLDDPHWAANPGQCDPV